MVVVAVPGQRLEIEFFADGQVEVERFVSPDAIEGAEALAAVFEDHG